MRLLLGLVALAALTACHASAAVAPPAPAPAPAASTPPTELRIPGLDEYRGSPRFLADRIYVIGRSATRLAYVNEPADEACGCYTPELVIEDFWAGGVLFKDRYDSGELDPANPSQLRNLDQLWRARGADWEYHVADYGITREPVPALQPIATGGDAVPHVEIHTEQVGEDSPEGYAHLTSYRIDLVASSKPTEIATSTSPPEYDLLHVSVPGYLPLRGDERAAVLVLENRRGWEGTPTVYNVRFVGADVDGAR